MSARAALPSGASGRRALLVLALALVPGCYESLLDEADSALCHSDNAYLSSRFEEALQHADRSVALDGDVPAGQLHRAFALHALGRWGEGLAAFERALELAGEVRRGSWWLACDCTKTREHLDTVYLDLLERNGLLEEMRSYASKVGDRHAELRALLAAGDVEVARQGLELHAEELAPLEGAWAVVIAGRAGDLDGARVLVAERVERDRDPAWLPALFKCLRSSLGGPHETTLFDYQEALASLDASGSYHVAWSLGRLGLSRPSFEAWGLALPAIRTELPQVCLYTARIGQSHAAAVVAGR